MRSTNQVSHKAAHRLTPPRFHWLRLNGKGTSKLNDAQFGNGDNSNHDCPLPRDYP